MEYSASIIQCRTPPILEQQHNVSLWVHRTRPTESCIIFSDRVSCCRRFGGAYGDGYHHLVWESVLVMDITSMCERAWWWWISQGCARERACCWCIPCRYGATYRLPLTSKTTYKFQYAVNAEQSQIIHCIC